MTRFNLDPVLIAMIILALALQLGFGRGLPVRQRWLISGGWLVVALALTSPLCALSVSLFSARIAQHMVLMLVAAPLIAVGMPSTSRAAGWPLWMSAIAVFVSLWFWHMPVPYEATFGSVAIYWSMHLSLFGASIWLWSELLHHSRLHTAPALIAGALTSMQMGLLGAIFSLADQALFRSHLSTTWAWGLTPLEDQQLGGVLMWVPGIALFLWVSVRSLARLWSTAGGARAA